MGETRASSGHRLAFVLGLASLWLGLLGPLAIFAGWRAWRETLGSDWGHRVSLLSLAMGCFSTALLIAGVSRFAWAGIR